METFFYLCKKYVVPRILKNSLVMTPKLNPEKTFATMELKPRFDIVYLDEAWDFLESLPEKVQDKAVYNINKSRYVTDKTLFEKLGSSDIWEFRTAYNGMAYRLFAFWDKDEQTLVVATHGLIKKTQKTPAREIAKAERIRKAYMNTKENKK